MDTSKYNTNPDKTLNYPTKVSGNKISVLQIPAIKSARGGLNVNNDALRASKRKRMKNPKGVQ